MLLPCTVLLKPHCGLRHSCSIGTYFAASSTRWARCVDRFEVGDLGTDQPEDDRLVVGDESQRSEVAGTLVVVLEEVRIDIEVFEQHLGDRFVSAFGEPRAAKVATAQMYPDRQVVGPALQAQSLINAAYVRGSSSGSSPRSTAPARIFGSQR